jgi:hypothetical protein
MRNGTLKTNDIATRVRFSDTTRLIILNGD